jgi:hypothetical protein
MKLPDKMGEAIRVSNDKLIFVTKIVVIPEPLLILAVFIFGYVAGSHELAISLQQICIYLEHCSL